MSYTRSINSNYGSNGVGIPTRSSSLHGAKVLQTRRTSNDDASVTVASNSNNPNIKNIPRPHSVHARSRVSALSKSKDKDTQNYEVMDEVNNMLQNTNNSSSASLDKSPIRPKEREAKKISVSSKSNNNIESNSSNSSVRNRSTGSIKLTTSRREAENQNFTLGSNGNYDDYWIWGFGVYKRRQDKVFFICI